MSASAARLVPENHPVATEGQQAATSTGTQPGGSHDESGSGFPVERLPGQWVSVFDRLDLVAGFAHRWPVITSVRAAR